MNTVVNTFQTPAATLTEACANIVLLGTGQVGGEFLRILQQTPRNNIRLLAVANSRFAHYENDGVVAHAAERLSGRAATINDPARYADWLLAHHGPPVIVDATASDEIAAWHNVWLARDINVVTANKIAAANGWINPTGHSIYGDAATVGAGLPILSTLRRLHNAGDRITRIEGILSGSLAAIFNALQDGSTFSQALQNATDAGFTEPDPRTDLSGIDAARKLSILARVAGLQSKQAVHAQPVLPEAVMETDEDTFSDYLPTLDAVWQQRAAAAHKQNKVLRYLACADARKGVRIGVQAIARDNPLAQTSGADNIVCIHSEAYCDEPLVIRGAGAGPLVTARALLADIGDILAYCR